VKLVWFPAWLCQNYTFGESFGKKCPYCPYSMNLKTNRLIYNNEETSSDDRAEASDLIGFFSENYEFMERRLEVSGGEALMRRDIAFILAAIPHVWSMTSNTLLEEGVDAIIRTGAISRCHSWTASWHPCSGQEAKYERNIKTLASSGHPARATVVISRQTIDGLAKTVEFLRSLPLAGINWHLDAHGDPDAVPMLKAYADSILGDGVAYLAGPAPRGRICNRHDKLMALGPDGTLYQCVTFAYQNKFPVVRVGARTKLASLEKKVEWCDEECFACCDHIKHEGSK
jgi:MoaA/NifB/PqqE/SkfB family radical SAM enzyme